MKRILILLCLPLLFSCNPSNIDKKEVIKIENLNQLQSKIIDKWVVRRSSDGVNYEFNTNGKVLIYTDSQAIERYFKFQNDLLIISFDNSYSKYNSYSYEFINKEKLRLVCRSTSSEGFPVELGRNPILSEMFTFFKK